MEAFIERALNYIWGFGSVTVHVVLVFMLVHPLVKSIRFHKTASQQSTCAIKMRGLLRRCLSTTILFVGSDILVAVLVYSNQFEGKGFLEENVYNANGLFNSFVLTMTFKEWRVMCFPWNRFSGKGAR